MKYITDRHTYRRRIMPFIETGCVPLFGCGKEREGR